MASELPWTAEINGDHVIVVRHQVEDVNDWEQWYLLRADAHHDNKHADWELEKSHLDEAVEHDAGILDFGDLFCAMQGKWDKRKSADSLRPEHNCNNYLDKLVETAADFYQPYARNWILMADGNHETAIVNRHQTSLNEGLVNRLNDRTGEKVFHGGYSGWVRFAFTVHKTHRCSTRLWYIHGYAGGGQVTKDKIQAQRQQVYVSNADIMVSSHTHDSWQDESQRIRLNPSDKIETHPLTYVKVGTYKDEYGTGKSGWWVETGKPPKTTGAWWLKFFWNSRAERIDHQIIRAK